MNTTAQQQLTLLVVAPSKEILSLIKAVLTVDKNRILLADNDSDGFALAKAERPDVILASCSAQEIIPSLCTRVRRDPSLAETPFVVLTTSSNRKTFVTHFSNGCDQVLPIPFKCIDIYTAIGNARKRNQNNALQKIHVQYKSGLADFVEPIELDRLLGSDKILCFRRAGGVAMVGRDPIRCGRRANYTGPERRAMTT